MAKILLPVIEDLLCDKMVALLRAYLDVIQLAYYTSHTEDTVEYLRRAVNEYTRLRDDPEGPLVQLEIRPEGWYSPKQH